MDHNLEDSLNLESMDFDHSEDVVNQEDIPLENSSRLDSITMDMDDVGDQSHPLMESVSDEVIVSDLIEDPFPFQEYILQSNASSSHNIMVDPHQLNRLTAQPEPGVSLHTDTKPAASTKSNVVAVKVAQPKPTKRLVAAAPPREVAIAPKPPQSKPVQYAIAPKPVALVPNKQTPGAFNKIPISSSGNVKGSSVLTQLKKQLVMVPKKIKLMSSAQVEGVINTASSGIQYQVACTSEQAQLMANQKGNKPLLKFIQIQGQSGADKGQVFTNVPRARYVMQQKTVPLTKTRIIVKKSQIVQGPIIAGKKNIITIKPQNPTIQTSQGNVTTKKVVISNSNQKVLIKTNAATSTSQAIKDSGSTGQRTQFHPINVPGKGIQYIKLVTNQPQKASPKVTVPPKNFVFTDSKGNVIQMTAEKVLSGQSSSIVPGTVTAGGKGVVKAVKTQKKFVRIAPVSKAVTQSNSQPARSSQSLLAPMTCTSAIPSSAPTTSLSVPSLSSPVPSPSENAVSIEEFNDMVEQNKDKSVQQLFSNYIDNSRYSTDFTMDNDLSCATEDYSTANEYSTIEDSQLHDETVEESINPDERVDVKPTLQSLISDAVSEERESDNEMDNIRNEVEIEFERKRDSIRNASFMLQDDQIEHDISNPNQESIIIVPGSNYTERINDSMYSDDSQSYRNRHYYDQEDQKRVPLLSVEAECLPYSEDMRPESPSLDPDAAHQIDMRPRKACNCTKSQCLKLYCDCFANGEFCNNCNCKKCNNNLENEEIRQKAIRSCLERNPNAFRPKIGKSKTGGPEIIRRHTKGCNCKRSGCLKNYCECYEAKIACTAMCKCVGCRNVEETLVRRRDAIRLREKLNDPAFRPTASVGPAKQPCSFMTTEVIEAVCQCLVAAAGEGDVADPVHYVIDEFARCLQDVISASHHTL